MKRSWIGGMILILALNTSFSAFAKTTDEEKKIGKEAADQIAKDKTTKFVTDPAIVDRVERVGREVAKYVDEPDLNITFKVIDSTDVNAFSLPGGYIYLNKALVERCESDDELAGVIGHEIAHAAHHHMRQLLAKQKKLNWMTLALVLAGATTGADVGQAALLAQVVTLARVNGFGMKFETEADHYAVEYLSKSPYSPVGVLTFMEKLAHDDAFKGTSRMDMGIFQTHPLSKERVQALVDLLNKKGIPIDRRKVTTSLKVVAKEGKKGDPTPGEIWVGKTLIVSVTGDDAATPMERAQAIASRLDAIMDQNIGVQDIRVGPDNKTVWAKKALVMTVTPSDAKLIGKTEEEVAKQIQLSLQNLLWKEVYNSIY